jgi:hypothetical protein
MGIRVHLSQLDRTRGQREERRLARMSAEDRAWEQVNLQRHRETRSQLSP